MCGPLVIPIAMAVTAAVSAGAAIYSSNQQKHALEAQAKMQQDQTDASAQAQTMDRMQAARQQRAAARAAAAQSGVSGNSSDAVLNDIMMQEGTDVSRIEKNRENGDLETSAQVRSKSTEINGQLAASLANTGAKTYSNIGGYYANQTPPKTING
jgi:hypothetical protein